MEPQRPFLLDRRGPARLDDGGRKRVDDDRGAGDGAAGREVGALVERDTMLGAREPRSEEHTSELQSLMRISYAVFCLKKKTQINKHTNPTTIYDQQTAIHQPIQLQLTNATCERC